MKAREFMSTPVECLRPHTSLCLAAELMVRDGFAALPVVDEDNHLIGIVAECDLLRLHLATGGWHRRDRELTVREAMTSSVFAVSPGADLDDVAGHLLDGGFRSVPVVDGPHLLGIVSRRDLLRALLARKRPSGPAKEVLGPC